MGIVESSTSKMISGIMNATQNGILSWFEENHEQYLAHFPDEKKVAILTKAFAMELEKRESVPIEIEGHLVSTPLDGTLKRQPYLRLSIRNLEDGEPIGAPLILIDSRKLPNSEIESLTILWNDVSARCQAPPDTVAVILGELS